MPLPLTLRTVPRLAGLFLLLASTGLAFSCQSANPPPAAVTGAQAQAALDSFLGSFLAGEPGRRHFLAGTEGRAADFWKEAEMIEMVEDAYDRTGDPRYKALIGELYEGFVADLGKRWIGNKYNDDLMWMVLACLRAHRITGEARYLEQARYHFDAVWARGWDKTLGGGLYWTTDNVEKNTCINMPAALAAVQLAEALGDPSYRTKAEGLLAWQKANLFEPTTGQVYDNIGWDGEVVRRTYTYNQGTFIGACQALGDPDSARLALNYTRARMTTEGLLGETGGGDGGGFKGIFARWAWPFVTAQGLEDEYRPWFEKNARAAWSHRDPVRGLIHQNWSQPTGEGPLESWGCSSAVVWLLEVAR